MIISNFRNLKIVQRSVGSKIAYAQVDITEGFWFWKKTRTEIVYNDNVVVGQLFNIAWKWVSTGRFTPGSEVECLYSKYVAEQALNSWP